MPVGVDVIEGFFDCLVWLARHGTILKMKGTVLSGGMTVVVAFIGGFSTTVCVVLLVTGRGLMMMTRGVYSGMTFVVGVIGGFFDDCQCLCGLLSQERNQNTQEVKKNDI